MRRRREAGTAGAAVGCSEARKPTEAGSIAQREDAIIAALEQFGLDFMDEREQPEMQERDELF